MADTGVLCVKVGKWLHRQLKSEADARGVELSALVRAILHVHVTEDVRGEILGWQEETLTVVQLVRPERVEMVVRKRNLRGR